MTEVKSGEVHIGGIILERNKMEKATRRWLSVSQVGQLNRVLLEGQGLSTGKFLALARDLLIHLEERFVLPWKIRGAH